MQEDQQKGAMSSASKALALLKVVVESDDGVLGISDAADAIGLPKSTVHRLFKILEEYGFVGRIGTKYTTGNAVFELCESARLSEFGQIREVGLAGLAWLNERTASTVHLAVLRESQVYYLEKITGPGGTRIPSRVGTELPATCTALGKMLIAHQPESVMDEVLSKPLPRITRYSVRSAGELATQLTKARERGIATEVEEAQLGFGCIAAPITVGGEVVAALSVSLSTNSLRRSDHSSAVAEASRLVSERLNDSDLAVAT